jgi:hypothetical protein
VVVVLACPRQGVVDGIGKKLARIPKSALSLAKMEVAATRPRYHFLPMITRWRHWRSRLLAVFAALSLAAWLATIAGWAAAALRPDSIRWKWNPAHASFVLFTPANIDCVDQRVYPPAGADGVWFDATKLGQLSFSTNRGRWSGSTTYAPAAFVSPSRFGYGSASMQPGIVLTDPAGRTIRALTKITVIAIPWWPLVLMFSILPALWLRQRRKRLALMRRGYCATCGYDLRATPDRCPECGTVPDRSPVQPATPEPHPPRAHAEGSPP